MVGLDEIKAATSCSTPKSPTSNQHDEMNSHKSKPTWIKYGWWLMVHVRVGNCWLACLKPKLVSWAW